MRNKTKLRMAESRQEITEIVRSCAEDENLRRIVFEIDGMNIDQKDQFVRKIDNYFFSKSSDEDSQAYLFFKLILDDGVRTAVVESLKGSR